ncbi:hypothetical protein K8R78_03175 [bacterium]|nr:hypothetical protein [bacterium]
MKQIKQALERAVSNTSGAFAAALFENTGILVDVVDHKAGFHPETATMAYVEALRAAKQASLDAGGSGNVKNLLITTDQAQMLLVPVDETYIVGIGLEPDGNLGQARLALRRLCKELVNLL